MFLTTPVWQAAIMLTFALTIFSIILQILSNFSHDKESDKTSNLISSNQFLLLKIQKLQDDIINLNQDLVKLTKENVTLNNEIECLTNKVLKLQQQIEEK